MRERNPNHTDKEAGRWVAGITGASIIGAAFILLNTVIDEVHQTPTRTPITEAATPTVLTARRQPYWGYWPAVSRLQTMSPSPEPSPNPTPR